MEQIEQSLDLATGDEPRIFIDYVEPTVMTSDEGVRGMIESSTYTDWIRFQTPELWTFQDDVSLRLTQREQLGQTQQS